MKELLILIILLELLHLAITVFIVVAFGVSIDEIKMVLGIKKIPQNELKFPKNKFMKRIKDIRKLSQGTKIVNIHDGIIAFYEFLCVHPHCNEHVLLLDTWTQNAFKFLISNIEESANWQINYTNTDLLNYEYNYHLKKSDLLFSRIKAQKGGLL